MKLLTLINPLLLKIHYERDRRIYIGAYKARKNGMGTVMYFAE